jgi:hypothetical protein
MDKREDVDRPTSCFQPLTHTKLAVKPSCCRRAASDRLNVIGDHLLLLDGGRSGTQVFGKTAKFVAILPR